MNDNEQPSLTTRAKMLRDKGAKLKDAPILTKMNSAAEFGGEVADFIVELAERVDALTPFEDEGTQHA